MPKAIIKSSQSDIAKAVPRLFVLELNAGRIHSMNTDGTDRRTIVTGCRLPDGIVVDVETGHIYWTNRGVPDLNDGSIERADIDGKNRATIVAQGHTHTPKQMILDKKGGKLHWCDRKGMRVMRVNLDGSQLETLIEAGHGDADRRGPDAMVRWASDRSEIRKDLLDAKGSDNAGLGRILRANLEIPKGENPSSRSDIEVFFDSLPEPVDVELESRRWMFGCIFGLDGR